jgi:hypothetical protein
VVGVLGLYVVSAVGWAQSARPLLAPPVYAKVTSAPLNEISGIVKSPGNLNRYWVHNDSGDSARIFAITAEGKSILPTFSKFTSYGDEPEDNKNQWQGFPVLNAKHVDWEDIAVDQNYLYVADTGNNSNDRRDLGIYLISNTASTRSAVIQFLPVVYPEQTEFPPAQKHFDSESLFVANKQLYLITKHRSAGFTGELEAGANLYRLDSRNPDQPNRLTKIDSNAAIFAATGADVSPDGKQLAVTALDGLWLFQQPSNGEQWLSSAAQFYAWDRKHMQQVEAVTWMDNETLLLANEQRELFKVSLPELSKAVQP